MNNNIAKFRFDGYTVTKSLIEIKDQNRISSDLSVDFDLSGIDNRSENCFSLTMKIVISDKKNGNLKAEVTAVGNYSFDENCENKLLDNFFFVNAPAILFPYLRAHIATLSTLCGLNKPLTLPTLNITHLASMLSRKTERK